jgi:hypothetical protein
MPTRKRIFGGEGSVPAATPAVPATAAAAAAPSAAPEEVSIKGDLNKIEQLLNSIRYSTPVLFLWTHKLYLILVLIWLSVLFFGGPSEDIDEAERGFLGWGDCDLKSECNGNLECGNRNCGQFKEGGSSGSISWSANPLATQLVEDDADCCCIKDDTDGDDATCNEAPLLEGEGDCENYSLGGLRGDTCGENLVCGNSNCMNYSDAVDDNGNVVQGHQPWMNYDKLIEDEADCCCPDTDIDEDENPKCRDPNVAATHLLYDEVNVGGQCTTTSMCSGDNKCGNNNCGRFDEFPDDSTLDCCCDPNIWGQCDGSEDTLSCDGERFGRFFDYSLEDHTLYPCPSTNYKDDDVTLSQIEYENNPKSASNSSGYDFQDKCCEPGPAPTCETHIDECGNDPYHMDPINDYQTIECPEGGCNPNLCCQVKTCESYDCLAGTEKIAGITDCLTSGCENCCQEVQGS